VLTPYVYNLGATFPPRRPGFDTGSGQMGFVVDKVALGQVFSEHFGFPCQPSFHQLLHNQPHLSSGAGTIGQKWPQYMGLSPTPLARKKSWAVDEEGMWSASSSTCLIIEEGALCSQSRCGYVSNRVLKSVVLLSELSHF
jgi:hypothetical protein